MKALIEGRWHPEVRDRAAYEAARAAQPADLFRDRITQGGRFTPEPGRYHLYVSYACPFAHRTLICRTLKGLEKALPVSVLHPYWAPEGWAFAPDPAFAGTSEDSENGCAYLREIYVLARPDFTGRVTVPVLWDGANRTIVNTESAETVRMLDEAFTSDRAPLNPPGLAVEIDRLGGFIHERISFGVYDVGFARGQAAYDRAIAQLFSALDELEGRLGDGRAFLLGEAPTEPDVLLFPTLARFDPIYRPRFRCSLRPLADYPCLSAFLARFADLPGVDETLRLDHIARHYFDDWSEGDPSIVPAGASRRG